ncbi:lipoprotein-releasing system permease protein [Variovorax sp. HW608]|uniref:FtsX-like permease family protein n=1 Tax=Variovorax sp. HW608 TaxID=1034889 RepID=UPI00081FE33F|nr:FtsX-like permease family protein [Variovorax sp. HW608]SCK28007.1 lipoprotein-releasing system permease protein [Variovorax sp. HW608]
MKRGLPFEWIIAARFLREGRMQTTLIITGIAIGVAVIVFMSALLVALQANFIRRVLTAQAHIQLLPPKEVARVLERGGREAGIHDDAIVQAPLQRIKSIDQWQSIAAQIQAMPGVVLVSPSASGSALVVRGDASRAITLIGVDPQVYFRIVTVPEKIVHGAPRLTNTDILIGIDLASDLGVTVGDKLRVSTAAGRDNTLTVTGLFDLGNKGANQRTTYVALRTAQSLLGLVGGVSSIDVTVRDVYAAEDIARHITGATGVEADSWIATNAQFFTAVQAQKTSNTTIRFFVGLSVAFGIASVLVVSVVQKSREIGILRAMGISRGQVLRVFLLQGGLLGLMGSLGGSGMALVALWLWQRYARNPDGTPFFPVEIEPGLFLLSMLLATLTGLAAAFAPALRAARLDPVVAIRG